MIKVIIKKFIPAYDNTKDKKVRERYCVLAGVLGIICNIVLFAVKVIIGSLMNSISILSDAFNNLSDMGSSIISILGAKMSNRRPDREHPFGHGRMEYIASFVVSCIILVVGFELFRSSIDKIIHPEPVRFSVILIVILTLSMLVKIWMFYYNRYMGKQIDSTVLRAASSDSLNDVVATAAVILATIIGNYVSFPIDGIMGVVVSVLIMIAGFKIAKEVVDRLLGQRPDPALVNEITAMILSYNGIIGIHDMIVHNYGPGRNFASVHAEVSDDSDIIKTHEMIDQAEQDILRETGVMIVIHTDPVSLNSPEKMELMCLVKKIIAEIDPALTIHDFRITKGQSRINVIFDLVVPIETAPERRKEITSLITEKLRTADPRYVAVIQVDTSFVS
ncbi:MAG: cation transporter [Clostridiales bacterium]|jgi:cation diffusion facilitator family transporter|nr:cation transporter [Clostridiales bacterium]